MKAKRFFSAILGFVFLFAAVISASSCTRISAADLMAGVSAVQPEGKEADEAFTAASLGFSLSLFKKLAGAENNTLVSPFSVMLALAMAANGAEGETLEQMESLLGMSVEELNEYLYTYVSSLPNEEKCKLKTANSLWIRENSISVNTPYLEKLGGYYGAEAYAARFDSGTVNDINNWVKKNTDGMIDDIIGSIPDYMVFCIINAIVFDAEWQSVYEKTSISKGTFTAHNGEKRDVKFMAETENTCFFTEDASGFVKYYRGGRYAFVGVLPSGDMDEYIEGLTAEKFAEYFVFSDDYMERMAKVYLPKFEYSYGTSLADVLKELGMTDAFEASADLSGIGTGELFIDDILHETFISVDERGTKAGAVTAVKGGCGSAPEPQK